LWTLAPPVGLIADGRQEAKSPPDATQRTVHAPLFQKHQMTEPTADPIVAVEKSATDGLPKVFVGNLDYAVTEEELIEEFSKIGLVYVFANLAKKGHVFWKTVLLGIPLPRNPLGK
jgi:hypothetical protein